MADVYELRRARPRRSLPIPSGACQVFGALGGAEVNPSHGVVYSLRRQRANVEVWLRCGAFSWNLSVQEGVWPANFAKARQWVAAYAAGYGQTVSEAPPRKPRSPRPTGDDAKLLRVGGCREAWLSSPVPALFAEAAMRCQSARADCGAKGFCEYGTCDMQMEPLPREADAWDGADTPAC